MDQLSIHAYVYKNIIDASLDGIFKQIDRQEGANSSQGCLFACYRHNHVPVLHVRKAA